MNMCCIVLSYLNHTRTLACVKQLVDQPLQSIRVLENSADASEFERLRHGLRHCTRVTVSCAGASLGFAGGVNHVLREVLTGPCDAVLISNNDIVVPPGCVETLANEAQNRGLALAAPYIYRDPDRDRLWSRGHWYNAFTGLLTDRPLPLVPGGVFYLTGCFLLVQRHVFDTIGLLDESFFMYGEDIEFCARAARAGFHLGTVPQAQMYHMTGATARPNSLFYEYHVNRSHLLLCRRLFSSRTDQAFSLSLKLCQLTGRALVRSIRYRNANALRGFVAAAVTAPPPAP